MLMPFPTSVSTRLEELAHDGTSGATALAQQAATIVLQATDPQHEIPETDVPSVLTELTHAIVRAQPTIAPILNLGNRILQAIHHHSQERDLLGQIRGLAGAIVNQLETSNTRIALHAQALVNDGMVILTHSNSSAVRKSLLRSRESGRTFSVVCTESRPMKEGTELAQELGRHGISTTLIADAAMTSMLPEVNLVMVGADSVSLGGLVNKVGTSGLALGAQARRIPLHVLCGSEKFVPQAFVVIEKTKAAEELLPQSTAYVSVRNVYFDSTPLDQLTGIVSEEGISSIEEIRKTLTALESDFAIKPELLGPPFTSR
jgi:translation initiation factor 2B subunit (eIF-2B alpha/beta/delta family)